MKIVSLIAALAGVAFASTVSPTGAPSFGEIESVEITEDEIVEAAEEIVDDFSTEVEGFDTIVLVESASEDVVIAEKFNEENEVVEVMVFELEFDPVDDDTPGAKGVELSDDDFAIVLTELCEFAAEGLDVPVEALLCEAEYDDDGEVYVAFIFSSEPPPTASPTVEVVTESPSSLVVTESPTETPETESPTETPETDSPTEKETESPTEKETESPTENTDTESPTENMDTESPTEDTETESPTEDTETQSPTEEGQTQSPTEEGQTQSPTEEDDRDDDAAKASSSVWFKNIFADAGN